MLGGLVTNVAASDLPHGVSPDCQDIQFQIGSAKTRPGITSLYTLLNNPTVNSLSTYETLLEVPRFVSLDSLGVLRKDVNPGGALTPISSGILPNSFFKSAALFGRQYFAFGNGQNGTDLPRQYDDTNFDRLSQCGPGAAPGVADEAVSIPLQAPANGISVFAPLNINTISETGSIVTVVPTLAFNRAVGDPVVIAGVPVPGYNGTFTILAINATGTQFTYAAGVTGLAASAGGTWTPLIAIIGTTVPHGLGVGQTFNFSGVTAGGWNAVTFKVATLGAPTVATFYITAAQLALGSSGNGQLNFIGNIAAGKHQLSVIFVTRSGYYTKPAPPTSWTAVGGMRAVVGNIPTGPANVVARVIIFTAAAQASFYHLGPTGITLFSSNMVIPDNVTTTATFDFTDAALQLGTLDDPLFNQIVLPPVAGVIDYSNRLLSWGEQGNLQAFLNLSFDGGFALVTQGILPLGWTADPALFTGGGQASVLGFPVVFGDAYTIIGDGVAAIRGRMTQGAQVNYLGNPILLPNTPYSVRARIARNAALVQGTVHIHLFSASAGIDAGLDVTAAQAGLAYGVFTAQLTGGMAAPPADLVIRVYADGTPTATGVFGIDEIEIYPTNAQFNNSNVRASKGQLNTQGQESYDSQTGLLQYNLNDGQGVRTCFKIRERLYIVKEHSFGGTQDDGVSEPASWPILDVSKKVGTPSVNGVGIGEDWAVIVHRTGLYIFWGGEVLKISEEIQLTWDTINWLYGYLISVTVDTRRRRIYISAPFGAATQPNKTLVLDYHDVGSDASAIAANPPIHLTYTGAKRAFDRARKWCPWTIAANSVAQIEQANGQTQIYFGSNDGTGNINQLDDTGTIFTDNGAQIPSYYTTSFLPDRETKQGLQLSAHRNGFQYMTTFSQGVGTLGITVYLASLSNAIALNPQALVNPASKDIEMGMNQLTERMAVKFSNSGAGQWFDLQNMVLNVKTDPWAVVRGTP